SVAGHNRPPQGHRRPPRRGPPGDTDGAGARGTGPIPPRGARPGPRRRGGPAPCQTAPSRRLPLPRGAAPRPGRRHRRQQHRRRPPRRRRRHRRPPPHLPTRHCQEGETPMSVHDDLPHHLAQAYPDTPDDLRRLRERLATAAQAEGILDLAYRTVDSPVGPLLLAATDIGLVRVAYSREDHDTVLQTLADRISPR